ncbi:growth-regulating factor 3-like [Hordeum vulgare subsp. vulgare]|uniref:Growth-regulating factor n=1 Tax=Hordeum vulgare subsp. vulgare TaxID=112509 RepID=A0A8I7B3T2_HORVV|nr:growth-regulating factor 3-like [Hordeum vulgare subsp. vulgare]
MAMPFASLSPAADHHRSSPIFPFCRSSPLYSVGEEAAHQHPHPQQQQQQHAMSGARWAARPAPFTAAQYEELEQQALIYKYLVAGVPVPQDLLLPIRRGFETLASRFYHHHALGYGSYFGKKLDPEPGRCRRTDGKKWRCSKEAAQDSKYCERHMHRGRNRSRKPVETQLVASSHSQSQQHATAAFHNHSPYPAIATGGGSFALGSAQLHMDTAAPYATTAGAAGNKDFRYSAYGVRTSAIEEHNQFITAAMDTAMDNYSWRLMPSQASAFSLSSYPMLGTLSDLDQSAICSLAKTEREPLSFFGGGGDFDDDSAAVKQENQTLRPFFDEWPKDRDSWPELQDHDANNNSNAFSATKLSISMPVTSSDFSGTTAGSRSPNGIYSR